MCEKQHLLWYRRDSWSREKRVRLHYYLRRVDRWGKLRALWVTGWRIELWPLRLYLSAFICVSASIFVLFCIELHPNLTLALLRLLMDSDTQRKFVLYRQIQSITRKYIDFSSEHRWRLSILPMEQLFVTRVLQTHQALWPLGGGGGGGGAEKYSVTHIKAHVGSWRLGSVSEGGCDFFYPEMKETLSFSVPNRDDWLGSEFLSSQSFSPSPPAQPGEASDSAFHFLIHKNNYQMVHRSIITGRRIKSSLDILKRVRRTHSDWVGCVDDIMQQNKHRNIQGLKIEAMKKKNNEIWVISDQNRWSAVDRNMWFLTHV